MGIPAEKASNSALRAMEELQYVEEVLEKNPRDIFGYGKEALDHCRRILAKLPSCDNDPPNVSFEVTEPE